MRPLVSATGIKLSPTPPPEQQVGDGTTEMDEGEVDFGNIIIDECPMDEEETILDRPHLKPQGLFGISMVPSVIQVDGKVHVQLVTRDGTGEQLGKGEEVSLGLQLPQHVLIESSLKGQEDDGANVGNQTLEDRDVFEGLHFMDDNLTRGSKRYFDLEPEDNIDREASFLATADSRRVCQNCKKPGHQAAKCPHVICTTCGAMDEHERRDCPLSKVCYGCGQRGHFKSDCPDPVARNKRWTGCQRCGSREHTDKNCPTLWRIYTFYSETGRKEMLNRKKNAQGWEKEVIGGESSEDWCYNCAKTGHLGDDCPQRRGSLVRFTAPSAFSHEIASRGPFSDSFASKANLPPKPTHSRWTQEDSTDIPYTSAYDSFPGSNAGHRGREKQRQKMRAKNRDESDPDDWFTGNRRLSPQGRGGRNAITPQNGSRSQRSKHRPWDSEMRGRDWEQDRYERDHAGRSTASHGRRYPSSPRRSPIHQERERGERGGGSKTLVSRALRGQPTPRSRGSPVGSGVSLLDRIGSPNTPLSSPRSRRNKSEKDEERDWESEWRRGGGAGGNVSNWGKEMDKETKSLSIKGQAHNREKSTGQRYYGGYN
ncbi:hypothetical protein L204_103913 [Cryptococcus depauperatus]